MFLVWLLVAASACTAEPAPIGPVSGRMPEPAEATTCPRSGARVTVGAADAAMGLRVQDLLLTNCGERPYHLDGYPLLRVLDENGRPLDVRIVHGSSDIATLDGFDAPPRPLALRPGEVARTQLVWRNTNTGTGAPQVGERLSIAPAEGRPWQPVRLGEAAPDGLHLDLGSTGKLGIRAWYR